MTVNRKRAWEEPSGFLSLTRPWFKTQPIHAGRRRADPRPEFPYLLNHTLHAVPHAKYFYRTTVSHQSVLPDLQFKNCDSMTNSARPTSRPRMSASSILPDNPNYSDWSFKLTFNMDQHVYPVLSSVYLFSLFPQRKFQKERLRFSFLTELAFYQSFTKSHTHSEPCLALHELDWRSLGVRVWYLQWSPKRWHTVLCPKPQN